MPTTTEKKLPLKVGADPEFLMFHGPKHINAQTLMRTFMKSKPGLRQSDMGFTITGAGEIGWDGASSTGEIRPTAADSPKQLTENIGKLIEAMHKHMPFLDYTTLSIGNPIGGHIHLDVPARMVRSVQQDHETADGLYDEDMREKDRKKQQAEMNRVVKLLATFQMPVMASEHRISSMSRLNGGSYGQADDIRWDQRGSAGTLEVRGISAEWLTSRHITEATLAYFGVIMHEINERNDKLIKEPGILRTKGHIKAVQQMMLSDYSVIENAIIKSLAKTIKTFELYPKFKDEVDFILNAKAVMAEKEKHGWTMNSGWNLGGQSKPATKKDLLSEKKVIAKLKQGHLAIQDSMTVPYNDDYNVSLFSKAITDRITALNWKLGNEYFLFGLKKGLKGYAAMNCKTEEFYSRPENGSNATLLDTAQRMSSRFKQINNSSIRIDPKTGKTRKWGLNQVVIGIPYDPRVENKTKDLIELIWDIERGNKTAQPLDQFKSNGVDPEDQEELINGANSNIRNSNPRNNTIVNISSEYASTLNEEPAD